VSDIFDLFADDVPTPDPGSDNRRGSSKLAESSPELSDSQDQGDVVQQRISEPLERAVGELAAAVRFLPSGSQEFLAAPDLSAVIYAIQDVLDASGHPAAATAAARWLHYEQSGRRSSEVSAARARADALYRADLEAMDVGWEPLVLTEQSELPWRQPAEPVTSETEAPTPAPIVSRETIEWNGWQPGRGPVKGVHTRVVIEPTEPE